MSDQYRRRRGRPPMEGTAVERSVQTLLTTEQVQALDAYCERVGQSRSFVVRELIKAAIGT